MKKFKWLLSAIIILAAAAFTYAFTPAKHAVPKQKFNQHWQFNGTTVGEESDPSKYSLIIGSDPGCDGFGLYCVIDAPADPDNENQPDLSQFSVVATRTP
ncbi:MAG: hypothetical protein J0I09_00610 [Sphingobacteriia bacterium]|nr:hypothetical protein [Sphingobacteriia bacterium]